MISSSTDSLRFGVAAMVSAIVVVGACASAQASPASYAQVHYDAGKAALERGDHVAALDHFKACVPLVEGDEVETWKMLLAVAVTYKRSEAPQHAIEYFRRFVDRSSSHVALTEKWKARRAGAQATIAELEAELLKTHGILSVASDPAGASVFIDGVRAGADGDAKAPGGFYLTPGEHQVRLELFDHEPYSGTVSIAAGRLAAHQGMLPAVSFEPVMEPAVGTSARPMAEPHVVAESSSGGSSTAGAWALIGTGSAALVAGAVMTGVFIDTDNRLRSFIPSKTEDESVRRWSSLSGHWVTARDGQWIGYGIGVAGVTAGLVWLLLVDDDDEDQAAMQLPPLQMGPTAQGGLQASMRLSF